MFEMIAVVWQLDKCHGGAGDVRLIETGFTR